MSEPMLKPIRKIDGYLPIEDHGLVGDGATAALIGRDGSVAWLCLPRFDSPPLFCSLLDASRGGRFQIVPDNLREAAQAYEPDSAVLITDMECATGRLRLRDLCPLLSGADLSEDVPATRRELLRTATVLVGTVRLHLEIEPWGGGEAEPRDGGLRIRCNSQPDIILSLLSTIPLTGLRSSITLKAGQSLHTLLRWRESHLHDAFDAERLYEDTVAVWRRWLQSLTYRGPQITEAILTEAWNPVRGAR